MSWVAIGLLTVLSCPVMAVEEAAVGEVGALGMVELRPFPVLAGSQEWETGLGGEDLVKRMSGDVRVDLQTRGGTRYQTDITIRGGIFEGSGVSVGGLVLLDPQTGHYSAELPLAAEFFRAAQLQTGAANALHGFQSTSGTIDWQWRAMEATGWLGGLLGTDNHRGLFGGAGWATGDTLQWQVAAGWERGDGSRPNTDFEVKRVSGRMEWRPPGGDAILRLFGGYLEKFYGWPGMYTGRSFLNETEDYAVGLLGVQWELTGAGNRHRAGVYWRELVDDYEFMREEPNRLFEHRTRVLSLQGDGLVAGRAIEWEYSWALAADWLLRSTALTHGDFKRRQYGRAGLQGRRSWQMNTGDASLYAGVAVDGSSRDNGAASPWLGLSWQRSGRAGSLLRVHAEGSAASRVPGYTVLNSAPGGLFGGNAGLGRERALSYECGLLLEHNGWQLQLLGFVRDDRDLVDWVFARQAPNSRQAAAMNLEVRGLEASAGWRGSRMSWNLAYAALDKSPRYLRSDVDASYYVLNYARHRVMGSLQWQLHPRLQWGVDLEYRRFAANPLRSVGNTVALLGSRLRWQPMASSGWMLELRGSNMANAQYQPIPGVLGAGRELQLVSRISW